MSLSSPKGDVASTGSFLTLMRYPSLFAETPSTILMPAVLMMSNSSMFPSTTSIRGSANIAKEIEINIRAMAISFFIY